MDDIAITVCGYSLISDIPKSEIDYFESFNYTSEKEMLEFKDGSKCPKNYFLFRDYYDVWQPCYGNKFKPEECKSFEEFKDKLAVAQL